MTIVSDLLAKYRNVPAPQIGAQAQTVEADPAYPSDWIDIKTPEAGTIQLLVSDMLLRTYAFLCITSSGAYTVDWGDGTIDVVTSNTVAEHTYELGAGQSCSEGYTTFKVVISGAITTFKVNHHSLAAQTQIHGILAAVFNVTGLTTLANAFYKSSAPAVRCYLLRYFKNLQTLASCSRCDYMFTNCYSLISVDLTGLVAVGVIDGMFNSCPALISVDFSPLAAATSAASLMAYCSKLKTVDISMMVNVTSIKNFCQGALSLESANISGLTKVTDAEGAFTGCVSLKEITATDFGKDAASTTFLNAFYQCEQLAEIPLPLAKASIFTAKGESGKLNKLNTLTLSGSSAFGGASPQMDLRYCDLSAEELDAIYTMLPEVAASQVINVTGCTGQAASTKTIATTKGWVVDPA